MPPASADSKPMYAKDEKALCFHGELLYEAKVLEVKKIDPKDKSSPYEYRVHYKGWKNTWDDWVTQDRLRKLTDDNKELAANLRREVQQQTAQAKSRPSAPSKTRKQGSELGSGRGSEERNSSVPAGGRGTKRGRDNDIEKPKATTPAIPVPAEPSAAASPIASAPVTRATARTIVTPAKPAPKPKPRIQISHVEEEDVMDVLLRPAPPDEDEHLSKSTRSLIKTKPKAVPMFAPLIGGTSAYEKQTIRQELIDSGATLIPKEEWRQILIDEGIQSADGEHDDCDICLTTWLETCIPAGYLPADKEQWRHLSWLMDAPIDPKHHEKYLEAEREGDYAKMLYYERAEAEAVMPIVGRPKNLVVIDPPATEGPYDALRTENRPSLVNFLNTCEFWQEDGWTEDALALIPWFIMDDVRPAVLAKMPLSVIRNWPTRLQDKLPRDAPFRKGKDGLPMWTEARETKAAREAEEAAARDQPRPGERRRHYRTYDVDASGKKVRKPKKPQFNPFPAQVFKPESPAVFHDVPVVPSDRADDNDSDATIDDPDGNRLIDSTPFKEAARRMGINRDLSSPARPVRDLLPQGPIRLPPMKKTIISISSDETVIELGTQDEEDYKVPDGVFLGKGFVSSDFPRRNDWLPMSTKYSDSDDEEFIVQGSHPDYWLNIVFRNLPIFDNIYDCLEALYPISDEFKQEEHFVTRPSIRLSIPDQLKSLLVDDWENVTKSLLLVPLPSQAPANFIIDTYYNEEKNNRRLGSADADLLLELCCGLKLYFEKAVGKILLYRFERLQLAEIRKLWESGRYEEWEGKGPGDCYGAEHLTRMIVNMPEIIAQTNMDQQSIARLKEELTKFCTWLGRNSPKFFCAKYEKPSAEYVEAAR